MTHAKLTPQQIAKGIRLIRKVKPDWTVQKISQELGLSKSYIYRLLKLKEGNNENQSL